MDTAHTISMCSLAFENWNCEIIEFGEFEIAVPFKRKKAKVFPARFKHSIDMHPFVPPKNDILWWMVNKYLRKGQS